VVRSVYGPHFRNRIFECLGSHPRLVEPAKQILQSDVYIHQFKINAKAAFAGEVWEWHQDYIYWQREDGMREPRALTVAIFLDEVNEFNGPIVFIPGSHLGGVLSPVPLPAPPERAGNDVIGPSWNSDVAAKLTYSLSRETVAELVRQSGLCAPKGPIGSVLFFHCSIVHCSAPNMSPFDRAVALVTFNSVANMLSPVPSPRPNFLANRDSSPVRIMGNDVLSRLTLERGA